MRADGWVVLGVDPGARHTGLVVRQGRHLLAHRVVEVAADREKIAARHLRAATAAAAELLASVGETPAPFDGVLIAVEDVNEPTGQLGKINLRGLLGTATVLGAFLEHPWADMLPSTTCRTVTVPPGGNGSNAQVTYPAGLVTDGERRAGGSSLRRAGQSSLMRHCRSAWDVAGAAPMRAALAH